MSVLKTDYTIHDLEEGLLNDRNIIIPKSFIDFMKNFNFEYTEYYDVIEFLFAVKVLKDQTTTNNFFEDFLLSIERIVEIFPCVLNKNGRIQAKHVLDIMNLLVAIGNGEGGDDFYRTFKERRFGIDYQPFSTIATHPKYGTEEFHNMLIHQTFARPIMESFFKKQEGSDPSRSMNDFESPFESC